MFCNHCGISNEIDAKYCFHCGGSLSKFRRVKMLLHNRLSNTGFPFHSNPFLQALFDVSFDQFVSLKIIKVIYALSIFFAGLVALVSIIVGFSSSLFFGIFMLLIGAPMIFLLIVLYSRVLLEVILFNFRTADPEAETGEQPESTNGIEWNV